MLLLAGCLGACPGEDSALVKDTAPPCGEGEALEGARCLPVDCGIGVWGDLPDEADVAYVDSAGPADGDGSRERPFRTLVEGLEAQPTVYLAEGRYVAPEVIVGSGDVGRTLRGRCQELVTLEGDEFGSGIQWAASPGVTLLVQELTVVGTGGLFASLGTMRMEDSTMQGMARAAAWASNVGVLELERVRIEGVHGDTEGVGGWGLLAEGDGRIEAVDVEIVGYASAGAIAMDRGTINALRLVIGPGEPDHPEILAGVAAQDEGSSLTCTECLIEGAPSLGALVTKGATMTLSDSVVRQPDPVGGYAVGVLASGGTLTLVRTLIEGVEGYGVFLRGQADALLEAVEVRDTHLESEGLLGAGLGVFEDSDLVGTGITIVDTQGAAVWSDTQSWITLTDLTVSRVQGPPGFLGPALLASFATVDVTDFLIEGASGQAVVAQEVGVVVLRAGRIEGTLLVDGQALDLAVLDFSQIRAIDLQLDGPQAHGAAIKAGGDLYLERATLLPSDGVGVFVQEGGRASLLTASVQGRLGAGLGAVGENAVMAAYHVTVEGTRRRDDLKLASAFSSSAGASVFLMDAQAIDTEGYGLVAEQCKTLECEDCLIQDSVLAGAFVANEGTLRLVDVTVTGVEPEPASGLAMGVFAGSVEGLGAELSADGLQVDDAGYAALWVEGAKVTLTNSTLEGGPRVELLPGVQAYGHALYASGSSPVVANSTLRGAEGAGLFLNDAGATLSGLSFLDNSVDIHQQACSSEPIEPPEGVSATLCPEYDEPVLPMSFYGVVDLGGLQ